MGDGQGPPVILVVGAFNNRTTGAPLAEALAPHFTVYTYDRRGVATAGTRSRTRSSVRSRTFRTRLDALVARGRRGAAVELFQSEVIGIPPEVVAQVRSAPFRPALEAPRSFPPACTALWRARATISSRRS